MNYFLLCPHARLSRIFSWWQKIVLPIWHFYIVVFLGMYIIRDMLNDTIYVPPDIIATFNLLAPASNHFERCT